MTTDSMPAGGDPRRLLADVRHLARRVRLAQRVTWLPLLVLAVVTFAAMPVDWYGTEVVSDCKAIADGQVCHVRSVPAATVYWPAALVLAYGRSPYGYLRAARARGWAAGCCRTSLTGVALAVLFTAVCCSSARGLGARPSRDRTGRTG